MSERMIAGRSAADSTRYRPEIDGLRAIAVIPVVLYHAGFGLLGGGFVGVDIFFVISGYLITGILHREVIERRFSIARFYERRVRRIFPALFTMIAATLVVGLLLLLPSELTRLGHSAIAATVSASNIQFWRESGYFDANADTKPLLHTWSLAVEEQFYLAFPLLLWAIARWRQNLLMPVLGAIALISFVASILLLPIAPSATFYLLPTRAWELMIGGILSLLPAYRGRFAGGLALIGMLMIAAPILLYSDAVAFPGLAALPPCLGAALIIACSQGSFIGRALAFAPLRGVGLISYSLYLWHWPILVYAKFAFTYGPAVAGFCVALSLIMACLSWRFVERPFRRHGAGKPLRPLLAALATMILFCALGAATLSGLPGRMPADVVKLAAVDVTPSFPPAGIRAGRLFCA